MSKESLNIPKGKPGAVNRRTGNAMTKRKKNIMTSNNFQNTTQKTKD